jgi:hypothetical protein
VQGANRLSGYPGFPRACGGADHHIVILDPFEGFLLERVRMEWTRFGNTDLAKNGSECRIDAGLGILGRKSIASSVVVVKS